MKKYFKGLFILLLSFGVAMTTNQFKGQTTCVEARPVAQPGFGGGGGSFTPSNPYNTPVDNSPKITFFAHGLGGRARDWSNDYDGDKFDSNTVKFEYDYYSIFEKMRKIYLEKNGESMKLFVYVNYNVADPFTTKGIYECVKDSNSNKYSYNFYSISNINKITFSKHSIFAIQYNSWSSYSLEQACSNYKKCVDNVIDAYASSHSGEKPKINLVGQSFGGLVNLAYTIAYHDRVSSLISLGTPYNGSSLDNDIVTTLGIDDFVKYPCLCGKCNHSYYMCDLELRKTEWNKVYKTHTNINFVAISGNTSFDLIEWMIATGDLAQGAYDSSGEWYSYFLGLLIGDTSFTKIGGILLGTQGFNTDFCVDVDSQRAIGYDGVIHFDKTFYYLNSNVDKHSQEGPSFPHNLETYDSFMHSIIISVLDFGFPKIAKNHDESNISISLINKVSNSWIIKLTNYTGKEREFFYNSKMCYEGAADSWCGLKDVCSTGIIYSGSSTYLIIEENLSATDITISYEDDYGMRQIICADKLNKDTLDCRTRHNSFKFHNYDEYDLNVKILGKNNDTWKFRITNKCTAPIYCFYYKKMCSLNDAKNWLGLHDVSEGFVLDSKESIDIFIDEDGSNDSVAISYLRGNYRYIFYANQLKTDSSMTAYKNCYDLDNPPVSGSGCVSEKTLITLADGSQKKVSDLKGNEMLLVWNLETGTYDIAPILFIDKDPKAKYEVVSLFFSDGTKVEVISEHGFFDINLNKYVYLDKNAENYIGHRFMKDENRVKKVVTLEKVKINERSVTPYSPVTYCHLCYFVDGMLSMPGGISGLFNYFDLDSNCMVYNQEKMNLDISTFGLCTYEELKALMPNLTEEMFNAVNGKYLKVAIGKRLISIETLEKLVERYGKFFK